MVFKLPDMLKFICTPDSAKYNPLDEVCYWIRSIHAHIRSPQDSEKEKRLKRVLLVGTHRDELPCISDDLQKIDDFIEAELILNKDIRYKDHIHPIDASLATYCTHYVPAYFVAVENSIDFKAGGESYLQNSGTKLVQDMLKAMSKALPYLEVSHPIKWLKFEERLKQQRQIHKACPVMKLEEIRALAVQSGISDEEQQDLAMNFLHDTGKIVCLSKTNPRS